jgi:FKBP-type peptidyl-prolyl cis-trans isomerase FkpA
MLAHPQHSFAGARARARRLALVAAAAAVAAVACLAAPAVASAQSGKVESTTFAPSLNVHLDSMLRRPSGLYSQELVAGTGTVATRGRQVLVRYSGWLPDGTLFDGGTESAEITVSLGTNATIKGWEEGLLGMRVGGTRRLVVPPSLAYGAKGSGPIPPDAVLVFEISVLEVRFGR